MKSSPDISWNEKGELKYREKPFKEATWWI
jgi:hypothetical protein